MGDPVFLVFSCVPCGHILLAYCVPSSPHRAIRDPSRSSQELGGDLAVFVAANNALSHVARHRALNIAKTRARRLTAQLAVLLGYQI